MSDHDVKPPCVTEAQFPPLPQWNVKPIEVRLAEAEALKGKLTDKQVQSIRNSILGSARDCVNITDRPPDFFHTRVPKIEDIQKSAAGYFKVTVMDILSHRRSNQVVRARQVAMYLSKLLTPRSLPEIGRRFGDRDHTTIMYSIRIITSILDGTHFDKRYVHAKKENCSDKNLPHDIEVLKKMIMEG